MKKFASLFLALTLCMGLATTAFAVDGESKTFTGSFRPEDTITINKVGKHELEHNSYELPVGAEVTLHLEKTGILCISKGDGQTIVHWTYDPTQNTMVRTDDADYYGHYNCQKLSAGDYTFTVTQEMADSFAAFNIPDAPPFYNPTLSMSGGRVTDFGADISVAILFAGTSSANPTTPSEPENPAVPETPEQPAESTAPTTPAVPATPGSHTVKKGDTYGTIALNSYGTYGAWNALAKANNYAKLTADTQLVLPEKLGKYERIEAPVAAEGETLYTVKAGDTLGAIAKTVYGDVMQYKAIFERNADRLVNTNTIYEGQVIVLPAK